MAPKLAQVAQDGAYLHQPLALRIVYNFTSLFITNFQCPRSSETAESSRKTGYPGDRQCAQRSLR